jgi:DNA-directed RNA polymerase sigma subunit (sigma70/sigma32)
VFGVPVEHVAADEDDVAEVATTRAVIPKLHRLISELPAQEQAVIIRHFGLFNVRPRGLREIATELGVSADTAMRRERAGIETLRERF